MNPADLLSALSALELELETVGDCLDAYECDDHADHRDELLAAVRSLVRVYRRGEQ